MKKCTKCNETKQLSEFGNRKSNKDGKRYHCKDCRNKYARGRYTSKLPPKITTEHAVIDGVSLKRHPEFTDYYISKDGMIWSNVTHKFLKSRSNQGYKQLCLMVHNKKITKRLHRLVADTYLGAKKGDVVRHLDDVKTNNHLSNLALGTHADNMRDIQINWAKKNKDIIEYVYTQPDAYHELKEKFGIAISRVRQIRDGEVFGYLTNHLPQPSYKKYKLSDAQVAEMRLLRKDYGMTLNELAIRFNISESSVSRIINNKRR